MATLLTKGTTLEKTFPTLPKNRTFLMFIGMTFLGSMHFFMKNPGGSGLSLPFNPVIWLTIGMGIGVALYQIANNGAIRYSKVTLVYCFCCGLLTLPSLYTLNSEFNATDRLFGLWGGLLFFISLQQFRFSNLEKQRLLWFIIIACVIEALFGYIQYFLLPEKNPFGYNAIANRPYGIFQQPNVMASFLATGMILSGYLLARQPQKKYDTKLHKTGLLCVVPVLTVPLLVILASRTGWLGGALGVALLIPYLRRFSTSKRVIAWLGAVVIGLMLGIFISSQGEGGDLVEKKLSIQTPRLTTFPQAIDMILEKPLTGYGYGQFENQYIRYTARQHQLNPDYRPGLAAMDHPHNEIMYWGVEGGIIPVLGLLLAAFITLNRVRSAKKGTRLALVALCTPIVLHSQLEYPFYHSAIHWITFLILLYWIDQRSAQYRLEPISTVSSKLLRILSLIVPILIGCFMLLNLHTNHLLTKYEISKPKNLNYLDQIIYPAGWDRRLGWDSYTTILTMGVSSRNNELIQQYIDWSLKHIQFEPRPASYANLFVAYYASNQLDKVELIRQEINYLFPEQDLQLDERIKAIFPTASQSISGGSH